MSVCVCVCLILCVVVCVGYCRWQWRQDVMVTKSAENSSVCLSVFLRVNETLGSICNMGDGRIEEI